jgi:hypothetical protein
MDSHPRILVEALARAFARVAEQQFRPSSPLYERLARGISDDPELLAMAAHARRGQPVPLLFLAAVHFLLLKGTPHPLAGFYSSLTTRPRSGDPFPAFRAFCFDYRDSILELIATQTVQTNEVKRSACLLPAFEVIRRTAPGRALALVEIGASAGLNLLGDRYYYDFGPGRQCGDASSPLHIHCSIRGRVSPPIPNTFPEIVDRVGLDLHPLDVRDPEAALWLRALVWPGQEERAALLEQALALARQHPPTVISGDALDLLPSVLAQRPAEAIHCIYHAHTTYQFTLEAREQLTSLIADQARQRDLFRISLEWKGEEQSELELTSFEAGKDTRKLLAYCHVHGEWIEWLYAS